MAFRCSFRSLLRACGYGTLYGLEDLMDRRIRAENNANARIKSSMERYLLLQGTLYSGDMEALWVPFPFVSVPSMRWRGSLL